MNDLIDRQETLKRIEHQQVVDKSVARRIILQAKAEADLISRQRVIKIINERKKQWHDERATAALNDCIFEIEHGGTNGRTDELAK